MTRSPRQQSLTKQVLRNYTIYLDNALQELSILSILFKAYSHQAKAKKTKE